MTILRFRSKTGQFRITCNDNDEFVKIFNEISQNNLKIPVELLRVKLNNGNIISVNDVQGVTVAQLGLKNGEMLAIDFIEGEGSNSASVAINNNPTEEKSNKPRQSKMDDELDNDKGLIKRQMGSFCRHGPRGMCEYCSPLPPWSEEYQADHGIKHLSFHAYLSELRSRLNENNQIPVLTPSRFTVLEKCPSGHLPWPRGICSQCQPSAISLNRQKYRLVDHVEILSPTIVDKFIGAWRNTGRQRVGLLLGKYDRYDKVPLGVNAIVSDIYELPQKDFDDGISIEDFSKDGENGKEFENVNKILLDMGMEILGMIYTDLSDAGTNDGKVICKRHNKSFFMSSSEVILAAKWQNKFNHHCKWSSEKNEEFSSRFVTCIISGNTNGEIDIAAYQASESAEALVKGDIIVGSTHPGQVYINNENDDKSKTRKRYIPDIFYEDKNEYGVIVKHKASPTFPVEYLLVSLTHGFPEESSSSENIFTYESTFPIEHRELHGENVSIDNIKNYIPHSIKFTQDMNIEETPIVVAELRDFHVQLWLQQHEGEFMSSEEVAQLRKVLFNNNDDVMQVAQYLNTCDGWRNLCAVAQLY
ncbi:nuclear protein localization protein 4 [Pichia kluyveri]|uniref:Nuclear protein localization protein 4 n=1 Tax=Pichia kluyveri TaxID=36015 RepID=A0AAV5R8C0_PICKL|nr:nuclear protein localization protein 4 [Pichia kluyveri]